jgi:hypothetical protein
LPLNLLESLARNLSILGALASGDASGDLKNPNGSRHGAANGKNVGGPDSLLLQATAGTLAIIQNPLKTGKEFIARVTRGLSERKVIGILDPKVLSKEIAEKLAKEPEQAAVAKVIAAWKKGDKKAIEKAVEELESFGKAMAPSLREAGVIMPYSRAKIFTRGWEGKFQAHHALEVQMMEDFKMGSAEDAPAIILSKTDHEAITAALDAARKEFKSTMGHEVSTPQELWTIYQKVYAGRPAWLEAIKSYFM